MRGGDSRLRWRRADSADARTDRGDEVVGKVGLVQSEYDTYLLLQRTDGSWLVVDPAEFPVPDDGTLPL